MISDDDDDDDGGGCGSDDDDDYDKNKNINNKGLSALEGVIRSQLQTNIYIYIYIQGLSKRFER